MSILFTCPVGVSLPAIPLSSCPINIGQIQKLIFQRIISTGTTKNNFVVLTKNPNIKASWTPLLAAADGTKVVQSPYLNAPTIVAGKARSFGGGNETLGGIPIIIGKEPTVFTGKFLNQSQDTIAALQKYQGESVGVFIVADSRPSTSAVLKKFDFMGV